MRYNPDFKIVIGIEPGRRSITANSDFIEICFREVCGDCMANSRRLDTVEIEAKDGVSKIGCVTRRMPGVRILKKCDSL